MFGPDDRVTSLILPDIRMWDAARVTQSFSTEEAEGILSIPLCQFSPDDVICWGVTRNGWLYGQVVLSACEERMRGMHFHHIPSSGAKGAFFPLGIDLEIVDC